jgi:hypothetical protein
VLHPGLMAPCHPWLSDASRVSSAVLSHLSWMHCLRELKVYWGWEILVLSLLYQKMGNSIAWQLEYWNCFERNVQMSYGHFFSQVVPQSLVMSEVIHMGVLVVVPPSHPLFPGHGRHDFFICYTWKNPKQFFLKCRYMKRFINCTLIPF